ncbi:hypothetical protein [Roseixanthobacter liquoris]|uniref:hypothetical protein n=1 Tax=Roseixanthobacter liquoris TaxID=3119921 RepID=UPI003727D067
MKKDALAQFALDQAQSIVSPDGHLTLEKVENGTAFIRYEVAPNEHCSTCTVTVDDLRIFLTDLFHSRAPHISGFDINMVDHSSS